MGNILGEKFDGYIQNQIKVRQESLGKYSNISPKDLIYYQNKTPWLRLASSVNIDNNDNPNFKRLNEILEGVSQENIGGNELSKKAILYGGVTDITENPNSKPQSGLRLQNDSIFSGAYGWGGGERGFVPQPGIVSADVTYYNNGALSKSTVTIKCFSREQFSIIDTLYMRPGYTVLLEFGWSVYLDKNGDNVELNSFDKFQSTALEKFLDGGVKDNFDIYKLIESDRETYKGNYNGVFGQISKFDWKFNNDGSYDITIQIVGMGDIIESLIIPATFSSTNKDLGGEEDKSFLHKKLQEYRDKITTSLQSSSTIGIIGIDLQIENFKGSESSNIEIPFSFYTIPQIKKEKFTSAVREDYISFGALMATIQNSFLLYNNNEPVYEFDINFNKIEEDENYIVCPPLTISSDPSKILIDVKENLNTPFNRYSLTPSDDKGSIVSRMLTLTPPRDKQNENFLLLSGVFINITFIENILDKHKNPKNNNINLLRVINEILDAINASTGNINHLSINLNNDIGKWQFRNSTPYMLKLHDKDKTSKFNLFGVLPKNQNQQTTQGSFIRDISLSSGLTNEWANLISVGAAASSTVNFIDSTSFKSYNKGLTDRIIKDRKDETSSIDQQREDENLVKNLKDSLKSIKIDYKNVYYDKDFTSGNISILTSKYSTFSGYLKEYYYKVFNYNLSFFLPFNLKLSMDGIGGIKLYQRFEMDTRVLPPMYDDEEIDLIINGINHSITPTGWITTLDSLSVPKQKEYTSGFNPDFLGGIRAENQIPTPNSSDSGNIGGNFT